MSDDELLFADDDELLFADDEQEGQQAEAEPWKILIVDDEAEIHNVTKMTLRNFQFAGRGLQFHHAYSGQEACQFLSQHRDVAAVLLDVVMETDDAGLRTVNTIRNDLNNHFIRVLLRTGQPGAAPEKQTIDTYDIDGYLPKAELTSHRLYVAVRTSLKAYGELVELERHREVLSMLHAFAVSMHAFDPLETTLWNLLQTAVSIAPSSLVLLNLNAYNEQEEWQNYFLHLTTQPERHTAEQLQAEFARLQNEPQVQNIQNSVALADGYLIALKLHHNLGYGWIYLQGAHPDHLTEQALLMLGAHASNGLYSLVSQAMLSSRESPLFDSINI